MHCGTRRSPVTEGGASLRMERAKPPSAFTMFILHRAVVELWTGHVTFSLVRPLSGRNRQIAIFLL
jgi:hypothetical protein